MPIEVLMPALSPTMTEGNLAKWHKKVGDPVKSGDVIAEIETDKATMEVEAVDEGTMGELLVPEGAQGVKVNQVIARLLGEGEEADALKSAPPPAAKPSPTPASASAPAPAPAAASAPAPVAAPVPAGAAAPAPAAKPAAATPAPRPAAPAANGHDRLFASPLARRMAAQAGLDLAAVSGSGPHGRIVKTDVETALKGGAARRAPSAAPIAPAMPATPGMAQVAALMGNAPYTPLPHTTMRRTIARRLGEVQQTVPVFFLTVDCEIDALLKARADINAQAESKISVNDFVIKAVALALRKMPAANASWSEDAILRWTNVDVSVAVALEQGLITPIIRNADQKGLAQISAEMRDLATRARAGKLKLEEFQGGTFSISNLGMYGVNEFTAVINPPQAAILAVAAGEQRAVVKNGALAVATVMRCTISCDHRVIDGAIAAEFMGVFRKFIESPVSMLL
jgi:pyruvate dehydrogenase E2 component (dihydrolipoamide acetyltransferase)